MRTYVSASQSMSLLEAQQLILRILKQVMEDKITPINVELSVVTIANPQLVSISAEEIEVRLGHDHHRVSLTAY